MNRDIGADQLAKNQPDPSQPEVRQPGGSQPDVRQPDLELKPLQDALNQAEAAAQACGRNLQLQVTPAGDLELVRRPSTQGSATSPTPIARLAGCDPLLWRAGHTGPAVTLGPPYTEPEPRCVVSGTVIVDRAPVELYYQGQPISAERALALAPLLVLVRHAVAAAGSVVEELGGWSSVENGELRGVLMDRGVREMVGRWVGFGG